MKILQILFFLVLVAAITEVVADFSITTESYFPDAKIIISPIVNGTNFTAYNATDTPANTLEMLINGSYIRWHADVNKTISNVSYNSSGAFWLFTGNGSSGYLNVSVLMTPLTQYNISQDSVVIQNNTSNEAGWVSFNFSLTSQHNYNISANNTGWSYFNAGTDHGYMTSVNISGTIRPYQLSLNVSNSTGTNNATWVFCNGHCLSNFTDLRFKLNNTVLLPFWIENTTGINATTARVWVNLTTLGTVQMYYGNTSLNVSTSDGNKTFPLFDHFIGISLNSSKWNSGGSGSLSITNSNLTLTDPKYVYSKAQFAGNHFIRVRARFGSDHDDHIMAGFEGTVGTNDKTKMSVPLRTDMEDYDTWMCTSGRSGHGYHSYEYWQPMDTTKWYIGEYRRGITADYCLLDDNASDSFSPNYYTNATRYAAMDAYTSDIIVDWILVGNYSLSGPVWGNWSVEQEMGETFIPPSPVFVSRISGSNWSNVTWAPGVGNVTDMYNVCVNATVCDNQTAAFINTSLSPHQQNNITVLAINISNITTNLVGFTSTYQNPNVVPVLSVIGTKKVYENRTLSIQLNGTDSDNDTLTYGTNATYGTLNTTSGLYTLTPNGSIAGNYTWYFNVTDTYSGSDSETIVVKIVANHTISISLYAGAWNNVMVNETQTFLSLDALYDAAYLAQWNATSQEFEKYKSGWQHRQNDTVSRNVGVMVKPESTFDASVLITNTSNYILFTGQNLIGVPENMTLSQINSSVNLNGNCTNVDEINYIYASNQTLKTFSCESGAGQNNSSVLVQAGYAVWMNAVQNVTILDALG